MQDALEAVIDDDRSLPLFEEAEKKFQETAAHGACISMFSPLLCPARLLVRQPEIPLQVSTSARTSCHQVAVTLCSRNYPARGDASPMS